MRKRLLALVLCAVLIGTVAATSAVSATQAGKSSIRHYDIKFLPAPDGTPRVYGTLTVDETTGSYVADGNLARVGEKDVGKGEAVGPTLLLAEKVPEMTHPLTIGQITFNKGGNFHGEGTLEPYAINFLDTWGDDPLLAWFF